MLISDIYSLIHLEITTSKQNKANNSIVGGSAYSVEPAFMELVCGEPRGERQRLYAFVYAGAILRLKFNA